MVALLLGAVAGLRTMTAPAVLLLVRHPSRTAGVLAVMALAEYAGDLYPEAPARTALDRCSRASPAEPFAAGS